ncbi:TPA: exodeoxyribonuclease VIII [Klebsiella oxytoca]|nr:exodeoxyribonuclease VIII [Klebsiella oxytoca]HEJ0352016.1 exodeoxyribonuclease VIII [Klebsiella oxytoca]
MSDLKTFICAAIPDEKSIEESGARKVARAFEAKDERHARAKCSLSFVEDYPGAQDAAYKFLICEAAPEIPCPSIDCWDENFMYEHDWDEEVGHPVIKAELKEPVDINTLSTDTKIAALVMYGHDDLTKDLIPAARALLQEESPTFEGHIVEAIHKTPEISAMHSERILNAVGWIMAKCAPTAKWPEIKAELVNWKKRLEGERKQGGPSKSVASIVRDKAANNALDMNPANDTEERPRRSYKHTYQTLDQEIANAFWPGDVNPGSVDGEIYRWAKKEVIEKDRDDWKRFSAALRTIEHALEYDLLTIRDLVQMRPDDIHKDAVHLNDYINAFLLSHGVFEDETKQNTSHADSSLDSSASTTGTVEPEQHDDDSVAGTLETAPHVERTGPFYYKEVNGDRWGRVNKYERLVEILSEDGFVEISKEEHQQLKNGVKPEPENNTPSSEEVDKQLAAQRGEYVEGISDKDDPRWVEGKPKEVPAPTIVTEPDTSFIVRADELDKELGDSENLKLWRNVMRTNPRYTKDMSDLGFGGTSINAEYMIMRATEMFGPVGLGWGWKVIEDKMLEGSPLSEKIFEGNKFIGKRTLRDSDGSLIYELNHYLKIELWYLAEGERATVESYGSTVYRQTTKHGIYCDSEVHKKSLTDAIKKALSTLGFSADIWLGLYDDAVYKAESKLEFEIKDASDKADDTARIREELDERFKGNVETMRKAVTQNEVSKIASSLTRTIAVHLKSAKETADNEYAKYLEGRLRRLEEVKAECLKNLEEKA